MEMGLPYVVGLLRDHPHRVVDLFQKEKVVVTSSCFLEDDEGEEQLINKVESLLLNPK